jgi:hypothetical protein
MSKIGDMDLGRKLIQEAILVSHYIEESSVRLQALSNIEKSVRNLSDAILGRSLFQEAVKVVSEIEDSSVLSQTLYSIAESISELGETDLSNQSFPDILKLGYQLKVSDDRSRIEQSIAKATATFGSTTAYSFFETNHESHPDIPEVVKAYTEEYRKIRWEEPSSQDLFSYYIRSFGWVPFEGEFAKEGAYDVISTLAKLGKIEEALEAGRGIGMIPEEPEKPTIDPRYTAKLKILQEDFELGDIDQDAFDSELLKLKNKFGVS